MRVGTLVSLPDEYSQFGRIVDHTGMGYTLEKGDLPDGVEVGDQLAYRVELWGGDSGLAYDVRK